MGSNQRGDYPSNGRTESLSAIKRTIKIGMILSIIRQDWLEGDGTSHFLGKRMVDRVQTNGVRFENGWYLRWPTANNVREVDGGFQIDLARTGDFMDIVEYQIVPED